METRRAESKNAETVNSNLLVALFNKRRKGPILPQTFLLLLRKHMRSKSRMITEKVLALLKKMLIMKLRRRNLRKRLKLVVPLNVVQHVGCLRKRHRNIRKAKTLLKIEQRYNLVYVRMKRRGRAEIIGMEIIVATYKTAEMVPRKKVTV